MSQVVSPPPYARTVPAIANGSKKTQATQILARLRSDIVHGRLAPGERLVVSALSESTGGGQTPIREALMRLASEGFVILEDQRGFAVAPVSRKELQDLAQARELVAAIVLRLAIEHGDDAWEGGLVAAFHRLQRQKRFTDDGSAMHPDWEQRHIDFHRALITACPNQVLLQQHTLLDERADRYRHLALRYLTAPRNDLAEHEAIMQATLRRDVPAATALLGEHIARTARIVLDKLALDS